MKFSPDIGVFVMFWFLQEPLLQIKCKLSCSLRSSVPWKFSCCPFRGVSGSGTCRCSRDPLMVPGDSSCSGKDIFFVSNNRYFVSSLDVARLLSPRSEELLLSPYRWMRLLGTIISPVSCMGYSGIQTPPHSLWSFIFLVFEIVLKIKEV